MKSGGYTVSFSAVADSGFPKGEGANSWGGPTYIAWPIFPENSTKLKKFGPGGGRPSYP